MPIFATVGQPGTVGPASGGKVTPVNNLGTTMVQVIGGNPSRAAITFHNPGLNTLYVAPTLNAQGNAFTPTLASLGGTFEIVAGGLLTITGECQMPWQALVATGSNQPLTVMESNIA